MVTYSHSNGDFHEIVVDHSKKKVSFEYPFGKLDPFVMRAVILIFTFGLLGYYMVAINLLQVHIEWFGIFYFIVISWFTMREFGWQNPLSKNYKLPHIYIKYGVDPRQWKEYLLTPQKVKSTIVEIENVGNIFTQYTLSGDFEKVLESFEIRLKPFKKTRRRYKFFGDKFVKNERWFFRITFSRLPRTGFMLIQNQKEFM